VTESDIDHDRNGVHDMPLLDLFLTMLWFFLFVAWIWLLISVYADVFRSGDLGGWSKASWVLLVLLLPYLGVLIYLIARGGSMQERSAAEAQRAQRATESYIREVASTPSTADELTKLGQLRDQGVLSTEEFETQKTKLLALA
jgi:type VI protein secretion system component VasK